MPDDKENLLLKKFETESSAAERKWAAKIKDIKRCRTWANGFVPSKTNVVSGDAQERVQANLILATNEGMLPHIYAKNPEVSVRPLSWVTDLDPMEYEAVKQFALTGQAAVNKSFSKGKLKKSMKALIRSSQTSKIGWLKVSYQRDIYTDPIIKNRLEDAQDNLRLLETKIKDVRKEHEPEDIQTVKALVGSLKKQVEIVRAEGVVFDKIDVENIRIDPGINDLQMYDKAKWIDHLEDIEEESIKAQYGLTDKDIEKLTAFKKTDTGESKQTYRIHERWDKSLNTIFTWAEGGKDWIKDPFAPTETGWRWYPFFLLGFHWIDGEEWPQSDVEGLVPLQIEYDDVRKMRIEHIGMSEPYMIFDSDTASPNDVASVTTASGREFVGIKGSGRPLSDIFKDGPKPSFNPQLYDVANILADLQWVSGLQDAERGGVLRAKTLGEAQIMQSGLASRVGERQDELEDFLTEVATYVLELLLQHWTIAIARKVAGPKAVWPEMDKRDIFELVEVKIKAGSTGKPDKAREQQVWSTGLQAFTELITKALEYRQQTQVQNDQNPYALLLQETLKRYDERLDIDEFLPKLETQNAGQPGSNQGINGANPGQAVGQPGTPGGIPGQNPGGIQ